jgi:hypothetical protein
MAIRNPGTSVIRRAARTLRSALAAAVMLASGLAAVQVTTAAEPAPPDFAGVWQNNEVSVTLAGHPNRPKFVYLGEFFRFKDQRIQLLRVTYDRTRGCHGLIFDDYQANQKAFELKLDGDTLILRWYDGPTLKLKREGQKRG